VIKYNEIHTNKNAVNVFYLSSRFRRRALGICGFDGTHTLRAVAYVHWTLLPLAGGDGKCSGAAAFGGGRQWRVASTACGALSGKACGCVLLSRGAPLTGRGTQSSYSQVWTGVDVRPIQAACTQGRGKPEPKLSARDSGTHTHKLFVSLVSTFSMYS